VKGFFPPQEEEILLRRRRSSSGDVFSLYNMYSLLRPRACAGAQQSGRAVNLSPGAL
jgi:hypothetical protein